MHTRTPKAGECSEARGCGMSMSCGPRVDLLCRSIDRWHETKLGLCDELEAIADSLPRAVDRTACLRAAERLLPALRDAQLYEETFVFPAFASDPARARTVLRLRAEHVEDQASAEELSEALMRIGHGGPVRNPEALGFMLRAFFDGLRRHVAFERDHIAAACH